MDVSYPPEAEAFRDRIREFVAEHLPPGWPGPGALPPHEREEFARHWRRALAGAGLVAVSWPTEYGGGGLSPMEQVVLAEEFARAGAPERAENDLLGIDLLGNTLIALGSEAQKRHFLPRILSGEHRWCQGFSEPEAGSDLASVRTRGVLDGDEWVINGHKIWTSAGTTANWIFLLARTDPSAAKHRGLSFLLVPMDQPGVVVRPIVNAAGHSSFSEVFLTDARTSAGNVVGRVGDGWSTAMTLLGFERGSHIATAAIDFERDLQRLCDLAVQYAGRRTQFDRPIGSFQAVKHACADMMIEIDATRATVMFAAMSAANGDELQTVAPLAKAQTAETFVLCAGSALQIHGAIAFTWEHDLHLYYRRAKTTEALFGSSARNRALLAERAGLVKA